MHVIGHDCPTGAVCVSTWSCAKVHVLLSSLIKAFFFFFLLITLAIRNAILEMYWRVITHMNSMNISWQHVGLNSSFKSMVEPRTSPVF